MTLPSLRCLVLLSLLVACSACAGATVRAPNTFATFEDQGGYLVRAATPEGIVLGVRAVSNEPRAHREFWVETVRTRLEKGRGYALLETRKVKARSGQPGTELRFGRDHSGEPYTYWIGIYVTKRYVYLVEAGGRTARFEAGKAEVEKAIASVELNGRPF